MNILLHFETQGGNGGSSGHPDHPGQVHERVLPLDRNFKQRAFTVGVGGPVGSGKTALMLQLCLGLGKTMNLAAVTNDIFTKEDGEFLTKHGDNLFTGQVAKHGEPFSAMRTGQFSGELLAQSR